MIQFRVVCFFANFRIFKGEFIHFFILKWTDIITQKKMKGNEKQYEFSFGFVHSLPNENAQYHNHNKYSDNQANNQSNIVWFILKEAINWMKNNFFKQAYLNWLFGWTCSRPLAWILQTHFLRQDIVACHAFFCWVWTIVLQPTPITNSVWIWTTRLYYFLKTIKSSMNSCF